MDLPALAKRSRRNPPKAVQIRVFRRDGWLCRWCGRPVVFAPAMKYLERLVRDLGHAGQLAYFHPNWSRQGAPLLDHLGAVVDHVEAFSRGGADSESNFVTACNKCNARKQAALSTDFETRSPRRPIKGKYGEPTAWDGFSSLFLILVEQDRSALTPSEAGWYAALQRDQADAIHQSSPPPTN